MKLTDSERQILAGDDGPARSLAMRVLAKLGSMFHAERFVEIEAAHVGGILFNGQASLDFAQHLNSLDARVAVPTTLNSGSIPLCQPDSYFGGQQSQTAASGLMACYVQMGGRPTWTCAPYLLPHTFPVGTQIAWSESGAVVVANSLLGARTDRYGSMTDICAAIAGRVPLAGLHLESNRKATVAFSIDGLPTRITAHEAFFQLLGYVVGARSGPHLPALLGLDPATQPDQLHALCAAAATTGALGMISIVGITPGVDTLSDATAGTGVTVHPITVEELRSAREELRGTGGGDRRIDAVCLGTPHFSLTEFEALQTALDDAGPVDQNTHLIVTTSRKVLADMDGSGLLAQLGQLGVTVITDVCSYNTQVLPPGVGVVMTNSAKWAHYGAGKHNIDVVLGTLKECARSASQGRLWREDYF